MSPATPKAIRQAHGPMSAIGSRITDSAYPAPAASASIDAANARAPSGASSITAIPPTISAAFTHARTSVWATVKITKFGAIALSPLAMHTPRTAPRRIRRRPRRSARPAATSAISAPSRVIASAPPSSPFDAWKVFATGSLS